MVFHLYSGKKEYGGPNVPDNETPQFEIRRKFTRK